MQLDRPARARLRCESRAAGTGAVHIGPSRAALLVVPRKLEIADLARDADNCSASWGAPGLRLKRPDCPKGNPHARDSAQWLRRETALFDILPDALIADSQQLRRST